MYGGGFGLPLFKLNKSTLMAKVKALWTLHGSYGTKKAGDEFEVTASVAEQLEKQGSVKIIDSKDADTKEKAEAPESKEKSVTITDNTVKEKKQITKPSTKK